MIMRIAIALFISLLVPGIALAHHSRAEFTDEVTEIEGVLINVIWRNPHIAMFLDVTTDAGEVETVRIETFGGPWAFEQAGVTSEMFQIGDRLRVVGRASTRRDAYFLGTNALLTGGTEVLMGVGFGRHWADGPVVGGATQFSGNNPVPVDAASENLGFFRVGMTRDFPFTEAAVVARAGWDSTDSWFTRCNPSGMPIAMLQPGHFQLTDINGQTLLLNAPWFDTVRTIHMNDSLNPTDQPATALGFSVGRWEDDALVVETTNIDYPYIRGDGTPQSRAIEVIERFTLSDDQTKLEYLMTIVDPVYLSRAATFEAYYLALNQEYFAIECNVF
jgi:hypothetical protein